MKERVLITDGGMPLARLSVATASKERARLARVSGHSICVSSEITWQRKHRGAFVSMLVDNRPFLMASCMARRVYFLKSNVQGLARIRPGMPRKTSSFAGLMPTNNQTGGSIR